MYQKSEIDFEICRKIQKKFATNYYLATLTLPKEQRLATHALYSFFRLPDEIVDSNFDTAPDILRKELQIFIDKWKVIFDTYPNFSLDQLAVSHSNNFDDNAVLRATAYIFHKYKIPFQLSIDFLNAMIMDCEVNRYEHYNKVKEYMYGSAGVVGYMMTYVMGYTDDSAFEYALYLGYAMQMTNFLRDVKEDYLDRNRIYLPLKDLVSFGINYEDIDRYCKTEKIDQKWIDYVKFEINRTKGLYEIAEEKGVPLLLPAGKRATKTALSLYRGILYQIEKDSFNVFSKRASVPKYKKIIYIIKSVLGLSTRN
jgi:phytoene synthase